MSTQCKGARYSLELAIALTEFDNKITNLLNYPDQLCNDTSLSRDTYIYAMEHAMPSATKNRVCFGVAVSE